MKIRELAENHKEYIINQRRHLHEHPELSLEEVETTKHLVEELKAMGFVVQTFDDFNGAIATLKGGKPGKTVLLRADIDALPVEEKTGLSYAAKNGNMHACGHDAHMAMQLGSAKILADLKDEISGTVKFLFQSAEEVGQGAKYYLNAGVLDGIDAAYGHHIWSDVDAGKFNLVAGERMAAADMFKITVKGLSSHASAPQHGKDALVAAASIVMNLQTLVSRVSDPLDPVVVTTGKLEAGQRWNIIANEAVLEGTVRTLNKEFRNGFEEKMRDLVEKTAEALGCTAELEYTYIVDPVVNEHEDLVNIARNAAIKLYGEESLQEMNKLLGGEDFCFIMNEIPSFFGFVGLYNEEIDCIYNNHNDKFNVDESTLHTGAALAAQFAYDFLEENA